MLTLSRYRGRLGNHLFAYCFGRILAEKFGYTYNCGKIECFSNNKNLEKGETSIILASARSSLISEALGEVNHCKHYRLLSH